MKSTEPASAPSSATAAKTVMAGFIARAATSASIDFAGFFFGDVEPAAADLDGGAPILAAADAALASLEPFAAPAIETALREAADRLGLKPRQAFQPIRVAVTGSKVSPGLFESIELLGRETTLNRLRAAAAGAA